MSAKVVPIRHDPLSGGFYTIRDAARFLGIESTQKLRGWIAGHANSGAEPIIKRTYAATSNNNELSFLDLMEMRFIHHFRKRDIPLQTLRVAAQNARQELNVSHPFALSGVRFVNERKKIFLDTANALGDKVLLNLITKQFELYKVIERSLEEGVSFDSRTGFAQQWHPKTSTPEVYLNPKCAFGQPVVGKEAVVTNAIFLTFQAENSNIGRVAKWYGLKPKLVEDAVKFELGLAA